jgi:hypothetical protein
MDTAQDMPQHQQSWWADGAGVGGTIGTGNAIREVVSGRSSQALEQPYDEQQDHRADHGQDDRTDHPTAELMHQETDWKAGHGG